MPYLRDFSLLFWYNESIKIKAVFPMMTQNADVYKRLRQCSAVPLQQSRQDQREN